MTHIDVEQARFNMIEQQIRPWDVLDQQILDIIARTPREAFVPEAYRNMAFADTEIPIGHGQRMLSPKLEARLLQALAVRPFELALEVGTGSGYLTALLSQLAKYVYSVELHADLAEAAQSRLAAHGFTNLTLDQGDAAEGWNNHGPYDVIAITGSLPELPEAYKHSLRIGGRLFVVEGEAPVMEARLITRMDEQYWATDDLFETVVPPLIHTRRPPRFDF